MGNYLQADWILVKDYSKEASFFALLSDLAGRAGLVVKAVAEPHALHIATSTPYSLLA